MYLLPSPNTRREAESGVGAEVEVGGGGGEITYVVYHACEGWDGGGGMWGGGGGSVEPVKFVGLCPIYPKRQ